MPGLACSLALLALGFASHHALAEIPDSAVLNALSDCTFLRTALVDKGTGDCEAIPPILKQCTELLAMKRDSSVAIPDKLQSENQPYGAKRSYIRFPTGSSILKSAVPDFECADFFIWPAPQGNSDNSSYYRPSGIPLDGGIFNSEASVMRTTCPIATSFGTTFAQAVFPLSNIKSVPPGSYSDRAIRLTLVGGDQHSADVRLTMDAVVQDQSGNYYQSEDKQCYAEYAVTFGSCFLSGTEGVEPTCNGGDSGGGSGGGDSGGGNGGGSAGGASASSPLPSVGTAALLVLSVLAVSVVGIAAVASVR